MTYEELKPRRLFEHFKAVSAIPRGSGNEEAIAAYVENFAAERGLFVKRDRYHNVFVRKPASPGREKDPAVVLQGHLDMVCEANSGVLHDFQKDPITFRLKEDGDTLQAEGTTLGADDGVAVALMLTLLEAEDVSHPALECLFTAEEETGLSGMTHFDASVVQGRRMINLDSAGEGEATVSCAGGVKSHFRFPASRSPLPGYDHTLSFRLSGLAGGHSGEDIATGRTGAIAAAARILYGASKKTGLALVSIDGGSKDNAIPRECAALLAVEHPAEAKAALEAEFDALCLSLVPEDRAVSLSLTEADAPDAPLCGSEHLLCLLNLLPSGVRAMSKSIPGLVETSSNLGVVKTEGDEVAITVSSRSSVETELDFMLRLMDGAASLSGAKVEHRSRYPGWAFTHGSPLQTLYLDTYRTLFGKEARVIGIHAGLECGIFKQKVPDMDIISIGPVIRNLHSPDETLSVSSFARLYRLLCAMLERMSQ